MTVNIVQWSCDCVGVKLPSGRAWVLKACDNREESNLCFFPRPDVESKNSRPFTEEEVLDLFEELGTAIGKAAAHDRLKWALEGLLK